MLHNFYPISKDFETIFSDFTDRAFKTSNSYPVFNIYYTEDNEEAFIEIAVTGMGEENLKAYKDDEGVLVIEGKFPEEPEGRNYVHRGLSRKDFVRKFKIENFEVEEIDVKNGLMKIHLKKVKPERKLIPINEKKEISS